MMQVLFALVADLKTNSRNEMAQLAHFLNIDTHRSGVLCLKGNRLARTLDFIDGFLVVSNLLLEGFK